MSQGSSVAEQGQGVEYGSENFQAMATSYKGAKGIVNAASKYDSLDDAIAALKGAWAVLEETSENGSGYTPNTALGFGSDNGAVVADKILGRANGVTATRKALVAMG